MNRRLFLRSSLTAAAGLVVGDAALEAWDRLQPRSLFAFPVNPLDKRLNAVLGSGNWTAYAELRTKEGLLVCRIPTEWKHQEGGYYSANVVLDPADFKEEGTYLVSVDPRLCVADARSISYAVEAKDMGYFTAEGGEIVLSTHAVDFGAWGALSP